MSIDEILAKEAQLLYTRAPGFSPVNGNLKHWRGDIKTKKKGNTNFTIEIMLPDTFPNAPPKVVSITPIKHKIVDNKTMLFNLKILKEWKPKTHIYEVINIIKGEFARKAPTPLGGALKPIAKPEMETSKKEEIDLSDPMGTVYSLENKLQMLEKEIDELQKKLSAKDEEITRLESVLAAHKVPTTTQKEIKKAVTPKDPTERLILDLEGEKMAVEELIKKLEEKFESGDI
ncbi:MAG: ubiquitin-conjugating enzyme E2, partial [Candidatus Odinarchaeia archaeon]